jgi:hypothetical protein
MMAGMTFTIEPILTGCWAPLHSLECSIMVYLVWMFVCLISFLLILFHWILTLILTNLLNAIMPGTILTMIQYKGQYRGYFDRSLLLMWTLIAFSLRWVKILCILFFWDDGRHDVRYRANFNRLLGITTFIRM